MKPAFLTLIPFGPPVLNMRYHISLVGKNPIAMQEIQSRIFWWVGNVTPEPTAEPIIK